MSFEFSTRSLDLQRRLTAFMDQHIYPNEHRFEDEVARNRQAGNVWIPTRLVDELTAQGARWIAFDVLFGELRHDHLPIQIQSNAPPVLPDEFFADRVRAAGNVSLAASSDLMPHRLFRDAAARLGDISTDRDTDGVLRRARAFQDKRIYHPVIERLAQAYDFKLDQAKVTPGKELVLVREKERLAIPLQTNNFFDITEFRSHFPTEKVMRGLSSSGLAYRDVRIWHTGILMAASVIGLDLAKAQVDLAVGQIFLPGTNRVSRTLTVDARGFFPVDWSIRPTDPRLKRESISSLLRNEKLRRDGHKDKIEEQWRNQVLVIGSIATAHDGGEPAGRWWFGAGAALASLLWFCGLGFGARLLAPFLARPRSWQVLELCIAATMVLVAVKLALG